MAPVLDFEWQLRREPAGSSADACELLTLGLGELTRRAKAQGHQDEAIHAALDGSSPKAALAALIAGGSGAGAAPADRAGCWMVESVRLDPSPSAIWDDEDSDA